MTPGATGEGSSFGAWLARRARLLALLKSHEYRRNALAIHAIALRRAVGVPTVLGLVGFPVLAAWVLLRFVAADDAATAFMVVQWLLAIAAAGSGATLYAADLRQGTLELLWLATGSERAMLGHRLAVVMTLLGGLAVALLVPVALLPVGAGVSVAGALVHLLITAWFVVAVMAWLGTLLPQAWTAGLLGLVVLGTWAWFWRESTSIMFPFLNPFVPAPSPGGPEGGRMEISTIVINRMIWLAASHLLLVAARRRLRRVFPGS